MMNRKVFCHTSLSGQLIVGMLWQSHHEDECHVVAKIISMIKAKLTKQSTMAEAKLKNSNQVPSNIMKTYYGIISSQDKAVILY